MYLLTLVSLLVGPVDSWPTKVIRAVFLEEPTLASIKTVVAFFYGNGVPFYMARQFYSLCNYHVFERATYFMRLHYETLKALRFMSHQPVYYNATFRRLMWINGRALDQTEFVVPPVSEIPIGIDATGNANTVRFKMHLIRDTRVVFPYWYKTGAIKYTHCLFYSLFTSLPLCSSIFTHLYLVSYS
jgi:hypothetical protein